MTEKMNPEVKADWVRALLSGEYQQTTGWLHTGPWRPEPEGFCCLGVLCDLAVKAGVIPEAGETPDGVYGYGDFDDDVHLPPEVQEWAGINDPNPSARGEEEARTLADLNDAYYTFAEIADVIEKVY